MKMLSNSSLKAVKRLYLVKSIRWFSDHQLVVPKKRRDILKITKKPCRPPFMKNVFCGVFDTEMLIYPELDKVKFQELKACIKPVEDFFINNVDQSAISSLHAIPSNLTDNLKDLGLFGQIIPSLYGGSEQTATETAMISECIGKDLDLALTLYSHNFLGAQALTLFGSEDQKAKYLPQLATGQKIAAFCLSESVSSSDVNNIRTTLEPSKNDMYVLNGEKHWITNANNASLFIVLTKWDMAVHTGGTIPIVRLVLVERDSPGVSVSKPIEYIGLNASNLCVVKFQNTPVPSSCFIGNERNSYEMCSKILNNGRYNIGAFTLSVLKTLLKKASDFIISRKQFTTPLSECELSQSKCLKVAHCIYTLESMTYHTAAILDNYDDPDCQLEQAIIKIFSFTEGKHCIDLIMDIFGGQAYSNSDIQKYFRDFRSLECFDGTTDLAKLFVSLLGLQHAGVDMNETVNKLRRPYEHPNFMLKYLMKGRRQLSDNPRLTLKLFEQLHPSLTNSANELEYCVLRLQFAVNIFFSRYGSDVINMQLELMRLADTAVKIYAMTCVLGRASRSYCIGLRNSESEVKYAIAICSKFKRQVRTDLNDLIDGLQVSGDISALKSGPDILEHHGYFLEHPIERSY